MALEQIAYPGACAPQVGLSASPGAGLLRLANGGGGQGGLCERGPGRVGWSWDGSPHSCPSGRDLTSAVLPPPGWRDTAPFSFRRSGFSAARGPGASGEPGGRRSRRGFPF